MMATRITSVAEVFLCEESSSFRNFFLQVLLAIVQVMFVVAKDAIPNRNLGVFKASLENMGSLAIFASIL